VSFSNALHLYRVRLRARALQECFAVLGIAAGVALLFASQIASSSLSSSVGELNSGIVGGATLQLTARDPHGFPEALAARARKLPGVRVAAALVEVPANATGPRGSESVELVGADDNLQKLGGALVRRVKATPFGTIGFLALPGPVATRIGVHRYGDVFGIQAHGSSTEAVLYKQLRASEVGPLIQSPVAVGPLEYAQEAAGLGGGGEEAAGSKGEEAAEPTSGGAAGSASGKTAGPASGGAGAPAGRITRLLVEPVRGHEAQVRAGLLRLAGGRLGVESSDYDEALFARAAAATNQSTQLFAVISALVGFLFAFNAMLLTVPQRRRLIADLRRDGYPPRAVIAVLLLDSAVLGAIACALGLVLGDELSIHLFRSNPGYLSSAFAVGSQRVVSWQSVAIAVAGGLGAAAVAVLSPLRDILSRDPLAAVAEREQGAGGGPRLSVWLGVVCLAATLAILLAAPQAAIAGMVTLILALLALLALPLAGMVALVRRLAPRIVSAVPHIASMELRSGRSRALAIAATGAIAVFGSVAIQGAHSDLQAGLYAASRDVNAQTDVWVAAAGSSNQLLTAPFPASALARLSALRGARTVRVYRGGLLDWGDRRVWVIAPPRAAVPLVPPSQLIEGSAARADALLRAPAGAPSGSSASAADGSPAASRGAAPIGGAGGSGPGARGAAPVAVGGGTTPGWAVVSSALADAHDLKIGDAFTLPSPNPATLRVAAISTNIGWAPGAIVINADEYARAWGSSDASAYQLLARPGVTPARLAAEARAALGPQTGLAVQTAHAREQQLNAVTRQGLTRLSQIATLILFAAVLAMAAAMGAMIWQRRPRLAKLKLEGFARVELWHTLVLESAMLLGVGCLSGALVGLFGQQLLDRALNLVINFPVVGSVGVVIALSSLALVTAAAVLMVAIPGWFAARVPAGLALQD
jgi:putative ABC transport system permease protein